ncbi:MAG: hypothetical protein LBG92_00725 [Prevotellaceae bacterium]|nr:hypothetical protein [Prevotellaceae bacterium]
MRKKSVYIFVASILFVSIFACETENGQNKKIIAEVGDKKLYQSEIENYFSGLSEKDSIAAVTNYINRWAKNQIVLLQAEKNLSETEKDVRDELENYRAALLTYRYEQAYIREKMDTSVNQEEIEQFYKNNPDNFKLPGILVKALFLKFPNDFPHLNKIRQLYRSDREKDAEELNKIAIQGAEIYTAFNYQWVDFNEITRNLPGTADSYENRIIRLKYIEDSDEKYTYFVKINEISMKEAVAPLEHVKHDIIKIILNRRKSELIKKMENEAFTAALNNKEIKLNTK